MPDTPRDPDDGATRSLLDRLEGMARLGAWYAQDGEDDSAIINIRHHRALVDVAIAAERRRQAIISHDERGKVMFDTQSGYANWLRSGDAMKQAESDLDDALSALHQHLTPTAATGSALDTGDAHDAGEERT